jgi:hypothetical protein
MMCHLNIEVDQAIHPVARVLDAIDESEFYIRSIRTVPVAWTKRVAVHLSLGGGGTPELEQLLGQLKLLPAVLSTEHTPMPI